MYDKLFVPIRKLSSESNEEMLAIIWTQTSHYFCSFAISWYWMAKLPVVLCTWQKAFFHFKIKEARISGFLSGVQIFDELFLFSLCMAYSLASEKPIPATHRIIFICSGSEVTEWSDLKPPVLAIELVEKKFTLRFCFNWY